MPSLADLSIVMPLAAGELAWRALWSELDAHGVAAERIVSAVDGDLQALPEAAVVVRGPAGRARQQNAGAARAGRRWLWFLHADSRLAPDTLAAIERIPEHDLLGYFDLRFHDGGPLMRLTALGADLRSRWLGMPFGDQGLLLPRGLFDALGGFDERLGSGEDHALVWAARRARVPLHRIGAPLHTSARKYRQHGWLRTTAQHWRATVEQAHRFSRSSA